MFSSLVSKVTRRAARSKRAAILEPIAERSQLAALYPWKDITQRLAIHCGESTRKLMRVSPSSAWPTPSIPLEDFIERLLRRSHAPLSASIGALAIINWMAEYDMSPLASSSPHHQFLSAYQLVVQSVWGMHWDDEAWVAMTDGFLPKEEIAATKLEVAEAMMVSTKGTREWEMLSWLTQESTTGLIEEMFDEERIQSSEALFESKELRSMEYDMRTSGRWVVYEYDDDDESF